MAPIKVLSVFGTRPEAVKMAPLILEMRNRTHAISQKVCVTAQHREMLDQVLRVFEIVPDYDLNLMQARQTPTSVAASVMSALPSIFEAEKPDLVLVQGDTTTVMAAALAAAYARIKVGHVEAGLRTFDKGQPFPEEINRRVAAVAADLHFAPTPRAAENLVKEGIESRDVFTTGNTVIDALMIASARNATATRGGMPKADIRRVLLTTHRRENLGAPMESICDAVDQITRHYAGRVEVLFPVHPNPDVRRVVQSKIGSNPYVRLTEPLDYLGVIEALKICDIVLTDSGGIQEEAPGFGKPVLVLRNTTERPEGIEAGTARLVGTDAANIYRTVRKLLDSPAEYAAMANAVNPYGDGHAAKRIIDIICNRFSHK